MCRAKKQTAQRKPLFLNTFAYSTFYCTANSAKVIYTTITERKRRCEKQRMCYLMSRQRRSRSIWK